MAGGSRLASVAGRLCRQACPAPLTEADLAGVLAAGPAFLNVCRRNGVAPLVWKSLHRTGLGNALSPEVAKGFQEDVVRTSARNLGLLEDLKALAAAFGEAGLAPAVLKGPALIGRIYEDASLRPITDLDLLVRETDRAQADRVLLGAGCARHRTYPNLYTRGPTVVDVHTDVVGGFRIGGRRQATDFTTEGLLETSEPLAGYEPLRRLGDTDEALVSACHLVKHGFSRLIWLVDLVGCLQAIQRRGMATQLVLRARETRTARILRFTLAVARERLAWQPGRALRRAFPAPRLGAVDRCLLALSDSPDAPQVLEPVLLAPNIRNASARWRFLVETFLPRQAVLPQVLGGRPPGYRLLAAARRSGQLVRSYARALSRR